MGKDKKDVTEAAKEMMATYIVACTDLHSAIGPFATQKVADEVASALTSNNEKGCTFKTLILLLDGIKADSAAFKGTTKTTDWTQKGYL